MKNFVIVTLLLTTIFTVTINYRLRIENLDQLSAIDSLKNENAKQKNIIASHSVLITPPVCQTNYKPEPTLKNKSSDRILSGTTNPSNYSSRRLDSNLKNPNKSENLFQIHTGYGRTSTSIEETPTSFRQEDQNGFLYGVGYSRRVLDSTYIGVTVFSNKDFYFTTSWGF